MRGTVIRINKDRGFAFVRGEDGLSRFAHVRGFLQQLDFERLEEGHTVEFIPDVHPEDPSKLRATEVRRVTP